MRLLHQSHGWKLWRISASSEAAQLEPENEHQEVGVGRPIVIQRTARHGWRRRTIEHGVEHTFFHARTRVVGMFVPIVAKAQSLTIAQ